MIVYVVQRECGDYYCGCGGGHIVGVFTTLEEAGKVAGSAHSSVFRLTEVKVGEARWVENLFNSDPPASLHGWT